KEPLPERVVDQEERHAQQQRIVEVLQAIALQGAEIVGVSELGAQLLEDRPVAVAAGAAELALQIGAEIGLHGVVVEERVVHVEQERDLLRCRDRKSTRLNSSHVATSYAVFCL